MGPDSQPSGSWFKLGFPLGYICDVLQAIEALCEAGAAGDPHLDRAVDWVVGQQDSVGRWTNRHSYRGKTTGDFDDSGPSSKWVTLRACRMLKDVVEARAAKPA
jgi:hypothetical protein